MVKSFLKMATLTASLMVFSCDTYKEEIKELPIKNYGEGSIKDIYSDDFVPHVVKKGDNLSNILKSKGVSPVRKNVKEVICGHYDNCKKIKVGTKVYIPKKLFNQEKEVKITHIESQLEKVRDLDKYHKHNVRKGENLSNILKSKGVSPTQANISQVICGKRNNCNKIQAGEKVYIPKTLLRN